MKLLAKNKRAVFDYEITERIIAGIVLSGSEVKSAKLGHISLKGSFVTIKDGQAYLLNAHITPYSKSTSQTGYDPTQSRKLLLHQKQIARLTGQIKTEGQTALPVAILVERGLIKVEVALGRGKKKYDKRQDLKKHEQLREAQRAMRPKN